MKNLFLAIVFFVFSAGAVAEQFSLSGKVKMIRHHQYLNNDGWDNYIWFCLDNSAAVSTCGKSSHCDNHVAFVIHKDTKPELFASLLASKMSQSPVTVWVDDNGKFLNDACYARIVDVK